MGERGSEAAASIFGLWGRSGRILWMRGSATPPGGGGGSCSLSDVHCSWKQSFSSAARARRWLWYHAMLDLEMLGSTSVTSYRRSLLLMPPKKKLRKTYLGEEGRRRKQKLFILSSSCFSFYMCSHQSGGSRGRKRTTHFSLTATVAMAATAAACDRA